MNDFFLSRKFWFCNEEIKKAEKLAFLFLLRKVFNEGVQFLQMSLQDPQQHFKFISIAAEIPCWRHFTLAATTELFSFWHPKGIKYTISKTVPFLRWLHWHLLFFASVILCIWEWHTCLIIDLRPEPIFFNKRPFGCRFVACLLGQLRCAISLWTFWKSTILVQYWERCWSLALKVIHLSNSASKNVFLLLERLLPS